MLADDFARSLRGYCKRIFDLSSAISQAAIDGTRVEDVAIDSGSVRVHASVVPIRFSPLFKLFRLTGDASPWPLR
jgi:hypothetical protein